MQQRARVERVMGAEAVVSVRRGTSCGESCASCGGCGRAGQSMQVTALNPIGAAVGDMVTLESKSRDVLGLAALVYLMPLALMIGGYALADRWLSLPGEGLAIAIALCGLVAGLGICARFSQKIRQRRSITFVIRDIL